MIPPIVGKSYVSAMSRTAEIAEQERVIAACGDAIFPLDYRPFCPKT